MTVKQTIVIMLHFKNVVSPHKSTTMMKTNQFHYTGVSGQFI